MTPRGRPPYGAGKYEAAFRFPSSLEEDAPKTKIVEGGYRPDCKTYVSKCCPHRWEKNEVCLLNTFCSLKIRLEAGPLVGTVRQYRLPNSGPPDRDFFPRLEASASRSSGAALFFSWGEGMLDSPPRSPSSTGVMTSSDTVRDAPPLWRLLWASPLFSFPSFNNT